MKLLERLSLASGVLLALSRPALAQATEVPEAAAASRDSLTLVKGFGLATVTEPSGQLHRVWVPVGLTGFAGMLPFYRRAEEINRLGNPWSISVDKVQTMRLNGVFYEHMVVRGKRRHLLAARVANGPVELFNYTETTQVLPGGLVGAAVAGAILAGTGGGGITERRWFVRQGAELVQVRRDTFAEQMSAYFQDDPLTVAAIAQQQVRYPDMLAIVQAYNQRRAGPAAPAK